MGTNHLVEDSPHALFFIAAVVVEALDFRNPEAQVRDFISICDCEPKLAIAALHQYWPGVGGACCRHQGVTGYCVN